MKQKTTLFLISFFILLSAVFMTYTYNLTKDRKPTLPTFGNPGHHVQDFSFTNQEGSIISQKDVQGKVYVVSYFFATCRGICPKMNEHLTKVYEAYKGNPKVLILSHTVDPKRDSFQALKAYSTRFDADPKQWMFLTGDKKALYNMARGSYLISALDDTAGVSIDKDFIHDNHYVLVDQSGHLRGFYDGLKVEEVNKLIGDIDILLKEK
jgi:protein SCO1/2